MKHLLLMLLFIPVVALAAPIKGVVRDETGQPLAGVTITVKGSALAARTDAEGRFSINANTGDVLLFSYVGLNTKEVTLTGLAELSVELAAGNKSLNTVIVTALGIKRSEKSLTYSTQQIGGNELLTAKTDNLMNSLSGKIAGVDIAPSASGIGGSTKVILRGNRSTGGNNQPLYVIDGVPISNEGNPFGQPMSSTYGGNPEGGDGISNLNPEDIESMTILKGASAAAVEIQHPPYPVLTKKGTAARAAGQHDVAGLHVAPGSRRGASRRRKRGRRRRRSAGPRRHGGWRSRRAWRRRHQLAPRRVAGGAEAPRAVGPSAIWCSRQRLLSCWLNEASALAAPASRQ